MTRKEADKHILCNAKSADGARQTERRKGDIKSGIKCGGSSVRDKMLLNPFWEEVLHHVLDTELRRVLF